MFGRVVIEPDSCFSKARDILIASLFETFPSSYCGKEDIDIPQPRFCTVYGKLHRSFVLKYLGNLKIKWTALTIA